MEEVERKFLVKSDEYKKQAIEKSSIVQGYLNSNPERSVRVRTKGKKGFITIKGKSNQSGTTRFEWEKEIPMEEAKTLLALCELGIIEKVRYLIPVGAQPSGSQFLFEVDEFSGENQGLVVAEIELEHENDTFPKPNWLGTEVTGKKQYFNAFLSKNPFNNW